MENIIIIFILQILVALMWFFLGKNYQKRQNTENPSLFLQNGEPMVRVDNTKFPAEVTIYSGKVILKK